MKQWVKHSHKWVLMVMIGIMALGSDAYAQVEPQKQDPGPIETGDGQNCRDRYEGDLLAVIVPCLRDEVARVTEEMTSQFSPMLEYPIYAFLTLVIAIFGVKVVMSEGDPKKDTMILLIKIGAVLLFVNNFGGYVPDAFAIVQEGVEITTATLDQGSVECQDAEGEKPWSYLDCVLGKLMGFAPDNFIGASALGLAGSALWSGQFGSVFFMGAVAGFFFILKLIIRATYTYLMAVFIMGFLIFLSPLFIPLIWMPATEQYFSRWLNAFISVMIMPAIVLGYLTLAFGVLDKIVFDEEIGVAKLLEKDEIKDMREMRASASSGCLMTNTQSAAQAAGRTFEYDDYERSDEFNPGVPWLSVCGDTNSFNQLYSFDFREGEAGKSGQIFFAFVALVVVAYVLDAMLEQLIQLAQIMLGGGFFMQAAVSGNPLERSLEEAHRGMGQAFNAGGVQGAMQQLGQTGQSVIAGLVGRR